jgi:D-sedoheptulose 7-phosphate isomerase
MSAENSGLPSQSERVKCEEIVGDAIIRARYAVDQLSRGTTLRHDITTVAQLLYHRMKNGKKVMICGNGGSAADAQHFAAELVVRYKKDRRALPALALSTDTSILTAGGNDLGFEQIFERQVEALGCEGDVLICISTSGQSENVLRARDAAKKKDIFVVGLTNAGGGQLTEWADLCLRVPATETAVVQTLHQIVYHSICEVIDDLCH